MPKFLVELNDGRKFQVEANRQPTPEEAMQLLGGGEQPALSDKPYLSQLGEALSTGYGQMTSGVGATFNALTGDTPDVAANLAEMGRLQREQQASRTAEDIALTQDFARSKAAYEQAQGPLETIEALGGYLGATARNPGAAFKQAVQSAPNALISGVTGLAGYGLGGLLGAGAGIETGPGAILTGIAGAAAGGAVSNTLMEAGPAIYDILNERTGGAAANMTADEITAYLNENPDVMSEGLKTGAIRGSVIGLVEGLGLKGAGALSTIPERAAARAVQKTLVDAGVDVASKEAVEAAVKNPAIFAAIKQAGETAKQQFSSAGNLARMGGAAGIVIGASGAGEAGAQMATGREVDPTEVYQEMLGEVGLSLPMALGSKIIDSRKYLSPTEGVTGMPPPLESQIAAEALNATTDTPFTDISGQAAADTIAQNTELAMRMPVQPVEAAEEIAPEVTSSLPETGLPPVVDQEAPAGTPVRAAPIQPATTQENAAPEIARGDKIIHDGVERIVADVLAHPQTGQTVVSFVEEPNKYFWPQAKTAGGTAQNAHSNMGVTPVSATTRNTETFPDVSDFGGKFDESLVFDPTSYEEYEGIGTATYLNPNTGLPDAYISAFGGDNDFIAYMRVYENGQPTNRFTSKLERRTNRPGATRTMVESLQRRLPANHEYTEDVSVSTDGLRFIQSQLNKGYEIATDKDGKPLLSEVAISGESLTNDLPIAVDPNGKFENIRVSNPKEAAKVRAHLLPILQAFRAGLTEKNIRWEDGTIFIDLPVLRKKSLSAVTATQENAPPEMEMHSPPQGVALSKVEAINKTKADLDERAKALGYDNARQLNMALQTQSALSDEQRQVLEGYGLLGQEIRALSWEDASDLSDGDFSTWAKSRFPAENPRMEEELRDAADLHRALTKRGDTQKAEQIREKIKNAKRRQDWTFESWNKQFPDEPYTREEIDTINADNAAWNAEVDAIIESFGETPILGEPPSKPKRGKKIQPITDLAAQTGEVQGEVITPPGEPTTATEGAFTPGGVATERDLTKVEQMTPEEIEALKLTTLKGVEKRGDGITFVPVKIMTVERLRKLRTKLEASRQQSPRGGPLVEIREWAEVSGDPYAKGWAILDRRARRAFRNNAAVEASAVDAYGIKPPEGYVRQGDLYVFQPQTTKAAAETQTPESVAVDSGAAGDVQSEPSRGSILEVEKESTKTAIESTGKSAPAGYGEVVNSARKSLKERPADFKAQEQVLSDLMKLPVADLQSAFEVVTGSPTKLANKRQLANNVLNELLAEAQDGKPTAAEDTFRKAEQEAEEEIQRQNAQSISNLFDKLRTNPQAGQVTRADVNQAIGALQNSGEVPNAIFTWNGTTDDLLRQRATMERQFPGAVAAASMPNVEGVFENGMAFVFSNRVVVTDLDRRKAAEEGISPSVAAVKRVVTHENMHKGLWLLSPKQQSDIMSFLRQMFPAAELDELAKSYRQYADWRTNPVHEMALLDERLQKYIEETKTIPTDGVWKQFWDYIKEIWRKLTGKPKGEPTLQSMKDVVRLIRSALKNAHKARPDRTIDGGRVLMSVSGGRSFVPAVNIDGRVEIGASHYDAWIKHALRQIPNFKKDGLSDEERRQLADRWIVDHPEFMAYSLRKEGFVSGGEFLNRQDSLKKFKSLGGVQQMAPGEPDRDWLDASDVEGYRFSYASEQDEASSIGQQTARYAASSPRTIETIVGVRQAYASMPKSNGAAVMLDDLFAETTKLVPNLTRPEFDRVVQGMYDDNAALLNDAQNPSSVTILPGAMMSMAGGANDAEYLAAVQAGDMDKAQRMVDEAAKAAIESNPRNAVELGRFLSKSEYESAREQVEELPREVFYVGNVEVIRNPTGDDIRGMTNEERSARGGRRSVDPDTRFTKDNYGNTWRWKATGGMHSMIEPSISRREGVEVNQNNGIPYHSDLVKDAIRSGEYIPSSTLSEYPNYADFVKPSSADPVTRDDAGNVIPLSQRFQTTSPDIRFSIASTPEQQSAAAKFKSAITAAAKGLPDLREYEGRLVKAASGEAIDVEPHNVLWFDGFMKASEQLLSDLQKQGLSLQQIYDKVAMDTEFKRELGLFDEETGSGQAATILSSLLTTKTFESARKAKTKEEKLRSDTLHRKAAAYYYGIGTVRGQNLVTLRLLQNDPRTRYMFMEDKVINEMLKKAEHGVNVQFGDGYAATQEAVKNAVNASAEAAKTEVADAVENATEEDQDAIDLAEGEATLKDPEKSLYEEYKDLLREEGILARLDKEEQDMGAKMSISPERRSELANLTKEERAKLREKNKRRRMEILSKLLGREEDAKTPEQKSTRKKREKMVKTAQKRAEKGQDIDAKATEQAAIEMAENKASQIVYRFEELYRQGFKNPPEGMSQKQQKDSIIKAFREQVKNPTSFEMFAERLENLKVGAEVAERLFLTASRERADLIRMKGFKAEKRKVEIADKQASRLIYSTEEKLRQGSKDLNTSKDGDSINKAFREQVESPMSETAFVKRLAALNVSAEAAARLFKTAAREKADQEAMLAYELLSGPDAFKKMAREVNAMRPSAEVPFMKRIPWREILRQPGKTVEEYRQNIFNAVNSNEAFKDLDEAQKRRLSELFAEAWQAQRDKILASMIEQHTYSLERQQKKEAAKALRDARNQIIEAVNLGAFSNDELTRVLGEKFGFKTSFTEDEKQKLSDLAEKLQDEKLNKAKRNKLAREFLSTLQSGTQIPIAELLSNWWVSAVLSGGNTVSAIALSFLNGTGIGIMGTHFSRALRELMKGNTANAIDAITSLFKAYAKHISSFPTAANRAWQYLWSGDVSFLESAANDPFGRVNTLADIAKYQVVADQVAKDPNKVKAVMGRFMRFMGRLLTALDAFNVMVTKAGTVSLAIRQSGLTPEQIRDAELKNDLKFYKDKIVREDPHFGGKQPTSAKEKAYLSSLAEAEMYADLVEMGVKMENADYLASESAMTMNPTGVGGIVYNAIKALDAKVTEETRKHLQMAEITWAKNKTVENATILFAWRAINFAAEQGLNAFGLRFARFAGNKFNQSSSFVPVLGLLRMIEADNKELSGRQEAFKDTIIRNQSIGAILMFAGWAIIKAIEEEPDDEKRGWFLNGGWNNLTPDQKKQKLSKGEKQYTLGIGDYVFNYQNWPISQPLAALGELSDLIRYSQDKWKAKTAGGKAGSAVISGMQAALEIPALTQVGEIFGNTMAAKDPAEQTVSRISRVISGWLGGFMPRILKDLDYIQDPTMRRYETLFQKVASHVPVYRRYVGSDYYDVLGNKIEKNAIPGSRDFMKLEDKPEYRMLGALNARGIWLTPANAEYRMVGKGRFRRRLTQEEADRYSLETGKLYRQMVMNYGPRALQMPVERAKDYISAKADDMRDLALQSAVRN